MSIEQKLAELERLAEQLDEAKRSVKKEAAEDDEDEDEPKGKDGDSEIDNDDESDEDKDKLDELSKSTLGSYVKKANRSGMRASADARETSHDDEGKESSGSLGKWHAKFAAKREKRAAGIGQAVSRLTKESVMLEEKTHTVDIDHTGGHDENAKMHNITLKKTGTHSHNATGTKKNLQKFLTKHYDDHDDAKDIHPEVFKEDYKIDLGGLFDGQELSEEFKKSATEIFEAAVSARVNQEVAELQESFEQQQLDEAVVLKESLVDKVDGYLDYVVEQWMNKNELAINRGIKTEILESFVSGMKQVFESHYIDVPDEKYDLVEAVKSEKEDLEQRLNEQTESIMYLKKNIKEMQKQFAIEESCKGLAETDAEKLRVLAEELVFSTVDEFTEKLVLIQENYLVVKKPQSKVLAEEFMTDVPIETIQEGVTVVDPSMRRYLKAIEKSGF